MRRYSRFGAALAIGLLAGGCGGDSPNNPLTPHAALTGPFPVTLPAPGDNQADGEEFEICKVGSSATFSYTIKDLQTGAVTTQTIAMANGECEVVALKGGPGAVVTVTETASQTGYQLNHVDVITVKGATTPVATTRTETGPTVSDTIGGSPIGFRGSLVRFFNEPIPAGSIGDFVWLDANGNGVQDAGEAGIPGLTVTLGGAASATTTTGANGDYLFTGLAAGSYTVTVATPSGYTASPSNQGGDPLKDSNGSPANVTLATNTSSDLSIDFGFVPIPPPPSGQIGDFVWDDANGNGIQDAGETGIAGLTVTLTGPVNASTTTNGSGGYLFAGLPAGNYTVTVATPSGYTASPSNQGGDPLMDSNGSPASVTLPTSSSSDLSIDFGFVPIPPPPSGQIGDFVWKDANGNGIQDAGETGFAGLTVTLTGPVNATTTTNAGGGYLFTGLPAGSYTVTVATPSGYTASPSNQGGDPLKDSNGSPASVTLPTSSSSNLSIDFGFVLIPPPPTGGQGCSPGYWKQSQHFASYPAGLTPNTLFSSIFENAFPGMTLVQVLSQGGGGLNALGRQIVAALLNASSPNVNYNITRAQVINQFNAVYPGGDYETLKNKLDGWNSTQVCPLN